MRRVGAMIVGVSLSALLLGSSMALPRPLPDARLTPVRVIHVKWGKIGYRAVGHGPPLVLLIGGGAPAPSIDDWPPALVNRLARRHRVLAMDYEGVGRTTLRPGTITITRLASDTADFIRALHLGRTDVLAWSMGGFVAQSLTIRHPGLVRRLVLCASALGDGTARMAKVSGRPAYPGQWLFPFDSHNRARARAFERAVHSYPHYYEGPQNVSNGEEVAIFFWLHGDVSEGHDASKIRVPVLVGDGTRDVLLPTPDSARLAQALPHSRLKLYHDAGHGFLVQHEADWARRTSRFLG